MTTIHCCSSMDNAYADYAIELLQLTSPNGSSVISPFSVASVLSMVYAGAEGNTKQEMINVLARGSRQNLKHNTFLLL